MVEKLVYLIAQIGFLRLHFYFKIYFEKKKKHTHIEKQ